MPDYRDAVHEYEYGDYEDQENRVGRLVTKSRLDPRHVSEEAAREVEDTNALRLQSGGDRRERSLVLLILSAALALISL